VHHGVHHGLHGLVLVLCALLLSRLPNRISLLLALMLAYGLANMANDDWLEQVAERGWTSWTIPSGLEPSLTWTWLAVLIATPLIWLFWFRRDDSVALPSG
jgi:xanthine/uracil permease